MGAGQGGRAARRLAGDPAQLERAVRDRPVRGRRRAAPPLLRRRRPAAAAHAAARRAGDAGAGGRRRGLRRARGPARPKCPPLAGSASSRTPPRSCGRRRSPGLLDETLETLGPAAAWTDVLAPVLRGLGDRWQRGDVCFALGMGADDGDLAGVRAVQPPLPGGGPGPAGAAGLLPGRAPLPADGGPARDAGRGGHPGRVRSASWSRPRRSPTSRPAWTRCWCCCGPWHPRRRTTSSPPASATSAARSGTAGPGWHHLGDRGFARVNDLASAVELAVAHAGA